jgi:hypothetical protein
MGMGNAYTTIVNDDESLFYNPAGIGKNSAFVWTIFDLRAGLNDLDAMSNLADLADESTFNTAMSNLYGNPIWTNVGLKTSFMMPYFGAAYFYDVEVGMLAQNPAATQLDINLILDTGVAVGGGFSAGFFQMGLVGRRIERTGFRGAFGPGDIATIVNGASPDNIFDNIQAKGLGYGVDFGMNISIPAPISPTFSFVWKDIGDTSFRSSIVADPLPPKQEQEMIFGVGIETSFPLITLAATADFKHLENNDEQIPKKMHLGIELGLPLIDLRAGLHQGYLSYGIGVSLGLLQIDAASYGVELGEYAGQIEDRRMLVQASVKIGFDPDIGFTTGSKGGGSSSASGGSGPGGTGSRGSSRRVKVRR